MKSALHRLFKRLMGATLALCLGLSLILTACDNNSKPISIIKGNYVDDTIAVAGRLKEAISLEEQNEVAEIEDEALAIITEYISIYRNRPQVAGLNSFTTMQTALNSLAGHYKNSPNRVLSNALRERLNNELTKAEDSVSRGT
ncbi:photosystem II protein Psb27 [Prochlorococcus sp. MIT 1341]|uniref:photosystem II protein Psb27 n=1 Tax=Prochlorococcus sp. MIT 1341 TaxID=3096221 RepID=UPI002A75189B|nr:photosystem II protein Psb27 [Prochlorococcus sp. MIT 1341]